MPGRDWQKDLETCQKALPPKWVVVPGEEMPDFGTWQFIATVGVMGKWKILRRWQLDGFRDEDIAHFIAEAREGWPAALERVRELEAQAAVMREALERAGEALLDPAYYGTTPDWITNALSADAGHELLERVRELEKENRRLRAVAEAANKLLSEYGYMDYRTMKSMQSLRQVLAALDGGEKKGE